MISEEIPRVIHQGSDTRGPFSLSVDGTPISFPSTDHIAVTRYDADGLPTELTENDHYTLSDDAAMPDVGEETQSFTAVTLTLEMTEDVLAETEFLLIERITPAQQNLVLRTAQGFSSAAFEKKLDEQMRLIQELRSKVARVVTIHALDPDGALEMATAADRANTLFAFDDDGDPEFLAVDDFQGEQGDPGAPGANGSIFYTDAGAPSGGLGTTTDRYLNTTNGDVYSKATGSWVLSGNIRGASGAGTGDMLKSENLSGLASASTARTNLGLGSIATAATSAYFAVANNLSEGIAATMRSNLGLGSMATQASSSVTITGGSVSGITDLAVADGGSGASTAAGARTNFGLGSIATFNETTTAEFRANTAGKALSTDKLWASAAFVALTDGATITPNFASGYNFNLDIGGNRTLVIPTNLKEGQTGTIYVTQDGSGGRTLSFNAAYKWAGGVDGFLSVAPGAIDRISYLVRNAGVGTEFIELTITKEIA